MIKVSIIVPVYNMQKYLDRCMNSLVNQTIDSYEIILVDDGSMDDSPKICDDYVMKYSNIKVIHKKNAGLGMARNSGLELASGEWIGFVDSDDFIELDMYKRLYELAINNNADMVSCFTYSKESASRNEYKVFNGKEEIEEIVYGMVGTPPEVETDMTFGMSVWRSIFKRSVLEENNIKFVSERKYSSEDIPFNLQYFSKINRVVYTNQGFYHYCYNSESLTHTFKEEKFEREKALVELVRSLLSYFGTEEKNRLSADRMFITKTRITLLNCSYATKELGLRKIYQIIRRIVNDSEVKRIINGYPGHMFKKKRKLFYILIKRRLSLCILIIGYIHGKKTKKI